jgi:hypothetical protein
MAEHKKAMIFGGFFAKKKSSRNWIVKKDVGAGWLIGSFQMALRHENGIGINSGDHRHLVCV